MGTHSYLHAMNRIPVSIDSGSLQPTRMELKILLIEDNPADARLVQREISRAGYRAVFERVQSREELLRALNDPTWDIVLSDFNVPGLNYVEALGLVQSTSIDLPIVLVSGSLGEECAVDLLKQGTWNFVLKDNLTRLVPAIEQSLREASERRSRKAAEAALRESEARLRSLGDNMPDGAVYQLTEMPDGSRSYNYISRGVEHLLGIPAEDVFENPDLIFSCIYPADVDLARRESHRARAQGHALDIELRMVHRRGEIRWMNVRGSPRRQPNGSIIWDGVVLDVSDRKRVEEQQTHLRQRF